MSWAYLGVSVLGALVAAAAWRPPRREPFGVLAFALAWVPSEVPLHFAAAGIAVTAVFAVFGGLSSWPGWVGLALAVASWAVLGRLAVVAFDSGSVVDAALEAALGREFVEQSTANGDRSEPHPAWWRAVLAIPYRPFDVVSVRNLDYAGDGDRRHRLDVFTSRASRPERAPVLVYVHGGAWAIGDKREQGRPMLFELARRGWVCVTINYRLSPRAAWPDHLVDCKRAIGWVRSHIGEFGGDPGFVAVSGGSAGGHLCAMVALTADDPRWQPGFEDEDTSVDACLPFYGVYDLTGDPEGMGLAGPGFLHFVEKRIMKEPIADDRERFERASPDRLVDASAPPMLVFHGANDSIVPKEVARRFVERLGAGSRSPVAYVELPRTQHAFDVLDSIRCRRTTRGAIRFLERIRHHHSEEADRPSR